MFSAIWNLINKDELKGYILQDKKIKKDLKEREKLEALKKELESKLEQTDDTEEAEDLDVAAQ